jgi:hypothetical protein
MASIIRTPSRAIGHIVATVFLSAEGQAQGIERNENPLDHIIIVGLGGAAEYEFMGRLLQRSGTVVVRVRGNPETCLNSRFARPQFLRKRVLNFLSP